MERIERSPQESFTEGHNPVLPDLLKLSSPAFLAFMYLSYKPCFFHHRYILSYLSALDHLQRLFSIGGCEVEIERVADVAVVFQHSPGGIGKSPGHPKDT